MFLVPHALLAASESVSNMQVIATLKEDRTLRVTETITYDFSTNKHHGIYREIPTKYSRDGGTYRLRLEVTDVKMDDREVPWKIESQSPVLVVRIGDPDQEIMGTHTYTISYETDRAINFFDGKGELYWNVTGNEWKVPIQSASFSLVGPAAYDANAAEALCFTGPFGSREQDCQIATQANSVQIFASRPLNAGEGLTIVAAFPEGLIAEPTLKEQIMRVLSDNWILGLPLVVFVIMFYVWYKKGREPKGRGTIVPQYEPPRGLAPIEMQGLSKQSISTSAVTATIIDLARRGFLKIEFGEEKNVLGWKSQEYTFVKQQASDASLQSFEAQILSGLFLSGDRTELKDLKGTFYKNYQKSVQQAFASLREKGLFGQNPNAVRATYIVGAVVVAALSMWLLPVVGLTGLGIAAIVASALIVAIFGFFMPAKTKEGAIALEEVEGFKWFLTVTEKDRLKFHNAPEVKPEQFHAFLPHAIAFGVEEQWAKQFEGLNVPPPTYASGYTTWNTLYFAHAMRSFNTAAASTAFVNPSSAGSGGSGFSGGGSGGGFGGGGGGSW